MNLNQRLVDMLSIKRPHATASELDWADRFILPYDPALYGSDDTMAYVVTVGESKTLFSSHVDTVHRSEGSQQLLYDPHKAMLYKGDDEPLGADDGAGVWLMLEMIDAQVPGTYVFHRGEECGGIGSTWMAEHEAKWLKQFDHAVAFDRKATHSVITHQIGGRCCSEDFAQALADAFNEANDTFMYYPDDTGVYTDTAEYVGLIAECTNVSCGYYDEHTSKERLDVAHLVALRNACIAIDWRRLPAVRKPIKENKELSLFGRHRERTVQARYAQQPLHTLSRDEMTDMAYEDPEYFVDRVFAAIHGLDDDDINGMLEMEADLQFPPRHFREEH